MQDLPTREEYRKQQEELKKKNTQQDNISKREEIRKKAESLEQNYRPKKKKLRFKKWVIAIFLLFFLSLLTISGLEIYNWLNDNNKTNNLQDDIVDNTKIKDLWHGNKLTSQNKYPSKTTLTYTMNLLTGEQEVIAVNNKKNIKQEMTIKNDLTVKNKNTYIKGKDGEFHKTDKFVGMDQLDGKFYTGSDIAKLFGTGKFNINSEEATHTFFNSITTDNIKTSLYENGTVVIEVDDGTTIKYIKQNENDKGIVQIEKDGILQEQYDTKGKPIK